MSDCQHHWQETNDGYRPYLVCSKCWKTRSCKSPDEISKDAAIAQAVEALEAIIGHEPLNSIVGYRKKEDREFFAGILRQSLQAVVSQLKALKAQIKAAFGAAGIDVKDAD